MCCWGSHSVAAVWAVQSGGSDDLRAFARGEGGSAAQPSADPRTPLLSIGYDTPDPHYQDMLRYAVRAAEARAPGVQYDVYAMLPAGGDAAQAQGSAVEVMRAILAQGVPASRVHLGLRTEPAGAARQVRVYVR